MKMVKERMDWVFVSRDWLLDWYWVADKETAMCLQGLRELLFMVFSFHFLVLFFVFFRLIHKPWVERSKRENLYPNAPS